MISQKNFDGRSGILNIVAEKVCYLSTLNLVYAYDFSRNSFLILK